MDKQLASYVLFVYSGANFLTFSAIAFPDARGGCLILLLVAFAIIALIALLNYIKTMKDAYADGVWSNDKESLLIGFAPGLFFGSVYLIGIISGIYLGWR